jgi:hypothetical protein
VTESRKPSMEMKFDSVFKEVAPGVATSGILAHKWGPSSDHVQLSEPPSNLEGD